VIYEKTLSRYISVNQKTINTDEEAEGEVEMELVGLEGVEPEVGLLSWAGEITVLVSCSNSQRCRIQLKYI